MTNNTMAVHDAFIASILANDDHWKTMIAEDVYLKGPLAEVQGKEDFITLNIPYFDSIESMETRQIIADGDSVVTQVTTTIKNPDGKNISFDVSEWYEIKDGKIHALRVYFDSRLLM